jgi:uncharacterized membrane protein YoaK (UPF0700 family)
MVNVVGLLSFKQQALTHLTGSTSLLSVALTSLNGWAVLHFMALLGAFIGGTTLSGLLIGNAPLRLRRRYVTALGVHAVLLVAAVPLLTDGRLAGIYVICGACGLQNGIGSIYSGGLVRTTHLTGLITDLGLALGHALRRVAVDARRVRLCLLIISAFFAGGPDRYGCLWAPGPGHAAHPRAPYRQHRAGLRRLPPQPPAPPQTVRLDLVLGIKYWVLGTEYRVTEPPGMHEGAVLITQYPVLNTLLPVYLLLGIFSF